MTITVADIDKLLPQTQCGECGYPGCKPYATAILAKQVSIDCCPPGGVATVKALGQLLQMDVAPYVAKAQAQMRAPATAIIREAECIGCTKCIQACPVDAIVGSGQLMHTVIADECTGCGLCVEPCPVDCIEMVELDTALYSRDTARKRFQERKTRLIRQEEAKQEIYQKKRKLAALESGLSQDLMAKNTYIIQALARAQAKKNQ